MLYNFRALYYLQKFKKSTVSYPEKKRQTPRQDISPKVTTSNYNTFSCELTNIKK